MPGWRRTWGLLALCHHAEREIPAPREPLHASLSPSGVLVTENPDRFHPHRSGAALPPGRAGSGFACALRSGASPGSDSHRRGTRCRAQERLPGKAPGPAVPGLLAQPPCLIRAACQPGCALGRVRSDSAPFFPLFPHPPPIFPSPLPPPYNRDKTRDINVRQ